MHKKSTLMQLMVMLLLILVIVGFSPKHNIFSTKAQNVVTSPTFNCLGPCPSGPSGPSSLSGGPSGSIFPSISISPSTMPSQIIQSISPSTAAPSTISQPCANTPTSSLLPLQSPLNDHGHHRGGRGRGGFLGGFFQFFLLLIELLLKLAGATSGIPAPTTPCAPAVSPIPSPLTTSIAPSIVGPSVLPAPGTSTASGSTTPTNQTPDIGPWGGYLITTTFPANSKISSDWTVTALDCSGGDGAISPWVGFGGYQQNDPNIAQLGNDMSCASGQATYPAWTEAYPANSVYSTNTMNAGDQMTAAVTYQGNGAFATTMTNKTQGWTITTPMPFASSYVPLTAEVALEELGGDNSSSGSNSSGGSSGNGSSQQIPVPKFAPLSFNNSSYSTNGQQTPLASGPGLVLMELGSSGNAQVTTSALSGGNFTETFVHN